MEQFRDGMGKEFLSEVDRMLHLVKAHPKIAASYEPPSRKLLVWKGRYGIVYVPEPRGIIVLAVAHLAQNPDTLRAKIRKLLGFE